MKHIVLLLFSCLLIFPLYSQTRLPIRENGKWGVIDNEGKVLVEPKYEYLGEFQQGLAVFRDLGKYGLLDTLYQPVVAADWEDLRLTPNYVLVAQEGRWGIVDFEGNTVIPPKFDRITSAPFGYFKAWGNHRVQLFSLQNGEVTPDAYEELEVYTPTLAEVWASDSTVGLIHLSNQENLLAPEYQSMQWDKGQTLKIKQGELWGIADTLGRITVPISFDSLYHYRKKVASDTLDFTVSGDLYEGVTLSGAAVLIDGYSGQCLIDSLYSRPYQLIEDSLWLVKPKDLPYQNLIYWSKGVVVREVVDYQYLSSDLISCKGMNGNWGLFSTLLDSLILPFEYTEIGMGDTGFAFAKRGGSQILIDAQGNHLGGSAYEEYLPLSPSRWAVFDGEYWGMIDSVGVELLPPSVDALYSLDTAFQVSIYKKENHYGVYNASGQLLTKAIYLKDDIELYPETQKVKASRQGNTLLLNLNKAGEVIDRVESNNLLSIRVRKQESSLGRRYVPGPPQFNRSTWSGLGRNLFARNGGRSNERVISYGGGSDNRWYLGRMDSLRIWRPLDRQRLARNPRLANSRRLRMPSPLDADSAQVIRLLVANYGRGEIRYALLDRNGNVNYQFPVYDSWRKKTLPMPIGFIGPFVEGRAVINVGGAYKDWQIRKMKLPRLTPQFFNRHKVYGGKWGIIDELGEIVVEPVFERLFDIHRGTAIAIKKRKWGVVDREGNTVIPFQYDSISRTGPDSTYFLLYDQKTKFGYIDSLGKEVLPAQFTEVDDYQSNGGIAVKDGDLWGYFDQHGNWLVKPVFMNARNFSGTMTEKLAAAQDSNGYWGYINRSGQWHIAPQFRDAQPFEGKYAFAKARRGGYGLLNSAGDWVIEPQFSRIEPSPVPDCYIVKPYGKGYGLINTENQWIIRPKYNEIKGYGDSKHFAVRKKRVWGLVNIEIGKQVLPCKYKSIAPFAEGLARVQRLNKHNGYKKWYYGYVNLEGKEVIKPQFIEASSFQEGFAAIRVITAGKYRESGYIDRKGTLVLDGYQGVEPFSEGKALVFKYRNRFGKLSGSYIVTPEGKPKFDLLYSPQASFSQGRMSVSWKAEKFFIDSLGYKVHTEGVPSSRYEYGVAWTLRPNGYGLADLAGLSLSADYYQKYWGWKNGIAKVAVRQSIGLANLKGEVIAQPIFPNITYLEKKVFLLERKGERSYFDAQKQQWIWRE